MKSLTIEEMHKLLRTGRAKLRPLHRIVGNKRKGYNKNYIRAWFNFGSRR